MSFVIDLSNLTRAQGFVIQGDAAGDAAGFSVSDAGDVNGDGLDDLIVGARNGDDGGENAGEAYVVYGKTGAARGVVDLTSLSAADGFIIQGDGAGDNAGISVSSAGDVNGDGIDDLIVGAPFGDDGGANAGEAYVVYGKLGATRGTVDLTTLVAADGLIIQGDVVGDEVGRAVSSAGDVNGDGIDDLIVGAPYGNNAGEAYVIYGKSGASRGLVDLTNLAAADGFIVQGDVANDGAGHSVSSAGDLNGDGLKDLIVGAPGGADGGNDAGEAYVIYGKTGTTRGTLDLTDLAAADGFIIQGDVAGDFAGWSVSNAGDINADGIEDVIVGAPVSSGLGPLTGKAYVIYGVAGATRGRLDLTNLAVSDGFEIQGAAAYDVAGVSVSAAGDVNGDGFDDVIIGASAAYYGSAGAAAYVVFGKAGAVRGDINLANLAPSDGFVIQGDAANDGAGGSVSSAGDVNGDGFDDLIVGAPSGVASGAIAGEAYVVYGFSMIYGAATADRLTGTALRDALLGLAGKDTLTGGAGDDELLGGAGLDRLTGGAGRDEFEFTTMRDMTTKLKTTDVILDFKRGQDKIDLSLIDASSKLTGENAFTFDGMKPFATSAQGEIYIKKFDLAGKPKDYTLVYIDTDGDRAAEGVIKVMGLHNFTAGDFIL